MSERSARQKMFGGVANHVRAVKAGPVLAAAMRAARTGTAEDEARFWLALDSLPKPQREAICQRVVDAMEAAALQCGADPDDLDDALGDFRARLNEAA